MTKVKQSLQMQVLRVCIKYHYTISNILSIGTSIEVITSLVDEILEKVITPCILIWDNLASHKNPDIVKKLQQNSTFFCVSCIESFPDIYVINLVEYLARYHQPCDNNAFALIKHAWREFTAQNSEYTAEEKCDKLLEICYNLSVEQVQSCFIRCGLPPYHLVCFFAS